MINLTQHKASPEQLDAGVVDLCEEDRSKLKELLTFDRIPSWMAVNNRAAEIVGLLFSRSGNGHSKAMIGGAPYLMAPLEHHLKKAGIEPFYSFTKRMVEEKDGVKISTFRHEGFVRGV